MKPYKTQPIPPSEITPSELFHARRKFMQLAGGASLAALLPRSVWAGDKLVDVKKIALHCAGRTNTFQGRDPIQQLLRIRYRQGRSR